MQLGAFSISLAVKDLEASKAFYQKFGFEAFAGDGKHYVMMRNGETLLGLFEGLFEQNILTFNPGWDQHCNTLEGFTDVRELQKSLKAQGVKLENEAFQDGGGPGSFVAVDPDGNPVLVDQHV